MREVRYQCVHLFANFNRVVTMTFCTVGFQVAIYLRLHICLPFGTCMNLYFVLFCATVLHCGLVKYLKQVSV